MEDLTATTNEPTTSTKGKKKPLNFVKSNSLGLLVAASTHSYHGPTMLHWEGGWHGEQKIQQVKPLLHIKWSNADWQTITLHQLYQHETIQRLLDDCVREENNDNQKIEKWKVCSRYMDHVKWTKMPFFMVNQLRLSWITTISCIYHIVLLVMLIQRDHLLT